MKIITDRELATVLAALRVYQGSLENNGGLPPRDVVEIASEGGEPLSSAEIDELCESMNFERPVAVNPDLLEALGGLRLFGGPGGTDAEEAALAAYDAATDDGDEED